MARAMKIVSLLVFALAALLAGCHPCVDKPRMVECLDGWGDRTHPCVDKPRMVECLDGWGDRTYRKNVNICEQKDGITRTEYGTRTGDCSCSYVHRERLCKDNQ
jgi:hypothetical protein